MLDDVPGELGSQTGYIREELLAGRVDFDTDPVDAARDDVVQLVFQGGLVDVVLILTDTDRFGSILTSSDSGSIIRLPIDTAPRTVRS